MCPNQSRPDNWSKHDISHRSHEMIWLLNLIDFVVVVFVVVIAVVFLVVTDPNKFNKPNLRRWVSARNILQKIIDCIAKYGNYCTKSGYLNIYMNITWIEIGSTSQYTSYFPRNSFCFVAHSSAKWRMYSRSAAKNGSTCQSTWLRPYAATKIALRMRYVRALVPLQPGGKWGSHLETSRSERRHWCGMYVCKSCIFNLHNGNI